MPLQLFAGTPAGVAVVKIPHGHWNSDLDCFLLLLLFFLIIILLFVLFIVLVVISARIGDFLV